MRYNLISTYQNLKLVSGSKIDHKSLNVINLSSECLNISQLLMLNSGQVGPDPSSFAGTLTDCEKNAIKALTEPSDSNATTEEAFKAVCSQAHQEYRRKKSSIECHLENIEK